MCCKVVKKGSVCFDYSSLSQHSAVSVAFVRILPVHNVCKAASGAPFTLRVLNTVIEVEEIKPLLREQYFN